MKRRAYDSVPSLSQPALKNPRFPALRIKRADQTLQQLLFNSPLLQRPRTLESLFSSSPSPRLRSRSNGSSEPREESGLRHRQRAGESRKSNGSLYLPLHRRIYPSLNPPPGAGSVGGLTPGGGRRCSWDLVLIAQLRMSARGGGKAEVSPEAFQARGFPGGEATGDVPRARKRIGKFVGSRNEHGRDLTCLRPPQPRIPPMARQRRRSRRGEGQKPTLTFRPLFWSRNRRRGTALHLQLCQTPSVAAGEGLQHWQVTNPSDGRHAGSEQEPAAASNARACPARAPEEGTGAGRTVSAPRGTAITQPPAPEPPAWRRGGKTAGRHCWRIKRGKASVKPGSPHFSYVSPRIS